MAAHCMACFFVKFGKLASVFSRLSSPARRRKYEAHSWRNWRSHSVRAACGPFRKSAVTSQVNSTRGLTVASFKTPVTLARWLWSERQHVPRRCEKNASLLLIIWRGKSPWAVFARCLCLLQVVGRLICKETGTQFDTRHVGCPVDVLRLRIERILTWRCALIRLMWLYFRPVCCTLELH